MKRPKQSGVRLKRGHLVANPPATTPAHGRPLAIAPARVVSRAPPGDPVQRYMVAQLERAIAKQRGDRREIIAAKRRTERARALLLATEGGLQECARINAAIRDVGPAIRTAAKAHVSVRDYAVRAALQFLQRVQEHKLETAAPVEKMGSACAWEALETMLRDRAFTIGFGEPQDGGPSFSECVKLAAACESSGRNSAGWALHLQVKADEAKDAPSLWQFTSGTPAPEEPDDPPDDHGEQPDVPEPDGERPDDATEAPSEEPDPIRDSRESLSRPDPVKLAGQAPARLTPHSTEWSHALNRMVPRRPPVPAPPPAPSPQPSPARRDVPPAPPLPHKAVMRQQPDGTWRPSPPPEPSRPSPTALRQMREKGIDTRRWEP